MICALATVRCGPDAEAVNKMYRTASKHLVKKEYDLALRMCRDILNNDPDYTNARVMIGKIHFFNNKIKTAEEHFREARDRDDRSIDALYWLARVQGKNPRKHDIALKNLELLLKMDGNHIGAWYEKGLLLELRKDNKGAMNAFRLAASKGSKIGYAHLKLARIYKNSGITAMSEKEFARAEFFARGDAFLAKRIARARAGTPVGAAKEGKDAKGVKGAGKAKKNK